MRSSGRAPCATPEPAGSSPSRGRTQIEKRFGAEFDRPVARMVELIGALGPRLTRATAEVADGLAAAGRDPADFAVVPEVIVSIGEDHAATRQLLAFYGSTPAYRMVLEAHGGG
jgi:hypothetical protein